MKKNIIVAALAFALASCGTSTKIVNSWRDPAVTVNSAALHKFVVAALMRNEATRRTVEDKMAAMYPGKAVPSYSIFGMDELKDSDDVYNQKLKNEGYDGIVVMRFLKVDKSTRYVPGSYPLYYGSWRGYWRSAWAGYYDPGYYTTDKTYNVEVNVYSLIRGKMVWSGETSTVDPGGSEALYESVLKAVTKKMKTEGFLM